MGLMQAADPKSYQLPFSSVFAQPKHSSRYNNHWGTTAFMIWIHGMCCLGPTTYSLRLALVTVPITLTFGLGIEMVGMNTSIKCNQDIQTCHMPHGHQECTLPLSDMLLAAPILGIFSALRQLL